MARSSRNLSLNLLARLVPRRFERQYLILAISHVNFAAMDYSRPKRSYAEVVSGSGKCFIYTFLYKLQSPYITSQDISKNTISHVLYT